MAFSRLAYTAKVRLIILEPPQSECKLIYFQVGVKVQAVRLSGSRTLVVHKLVTCSLASSDIQTYQWNMTDPVTED